MRWAGGWRDWARKKLWMGCLSIGPVCGCMYFFVLLWLMLEVCFISNNMVCVRYGLFARNGINLI